MIAQRSVLGAGWEEQPSEGSFALDSRTFPAAAVAAALEPSDARTPIPSLKSVLASPN